MRNDILHEFKLMEELLPVMSAEQREALASIETFVAIALRVFAKTNPSKIRDEARTVEISYLMNKLP